MKPSRDVATHATSSAMTADQLIAAKYELRPAYDGKARWLMNRHAVRQVALFKDSNSQYIWQPSFQMGQPDRLLNFPVAIG